MSELAFNINGEAFEVPAHATGWRVRKMRAKGSPEVVYAREGQPLVLPISAEIDDLRAEVDTTGRYRLDLVDQNNKAIEGAPSGYVQVNFEVDASSTGRAPAAATTASKASDNIVIEAMRINSEIAKSVVDRFPQMLEAAALLLRAADGAGMPAREPRATEEDERDNDEDEDDDAPAPSATPGMDLLNTLVAQVVPLVITAMSGKKLPKLGELLDWRKGGPQPALGHLSPAPVAEPADAPATDALPALDPKTMGHFLAIQSALKPDEAALARQVAAELAPAELRAWFDELAKLSVPDAVTKIRALIGTGAAS